MTPPKIPRERFDAAVKSMTDIGVKREDVSRVLKNLLELFDYNWEHIEADSYRALADAIFDDPFPKEGQKRQANKTKNLDSSHSNKKLKIKQQYKTPTSEIHGNGKRELSEAPLHQEAGMLPLQAFYEGKVTGNQLRLPSSRLPIKGSNKQINVVEDTSMGENSSALLFRGQGLQIETPLAVICPQVLDSSPLNGYKDAHMTSGVQQTADQKYRGVSVALERNMVDACSSQAIVSSDVFSTNFVVALSNSGAGKLLFTYDSSLVNRSNFHMPHMGSICKEMEARCLRTYKILEPNFSFMNLLEDTCQCIVDLGFESSGHREKSTLQIVPTVDFLSKSSVPQILQSNQASSSCMPPNNLTRLGGICSSGDVAGVCQSSSSNMQVAQHQINTGAKRPPHDVNDITKGEECVSIPIVNEVGNGILPPPFHYIPHNITFQNAYVNLSLARIGDANCCFDCFGDCLAQPLSCACATETGGEFAYTRDGLLKERFLDSCLSMSREPHKHPCFYCKICPVERPEIEVNPGPCKGHIIRKFIKECWSKCGCTRNCGNRVVQRGITRHLQVFLTPGKKGWGLRAAEELPQGAFVCEYVGEILTNTELDDRNIQKTGKAKHTYPVYLNADWGTEGFLKDDEALCLDGTFYGNVARFINHRCFDANIIDIPVEIESPDHHYYHLAFFTTRKVERFEELTWDYGIDFDDVNHPVEAFKCCCGSEFCRDKSRSSRSKSRALVLL